MNEMLNRLGMNAKAAETEMRNLSTNKKNEVLLAVADKLVKDAQTLINANRLDVNIAMLRPHSLHAPSIPLCKNISASYIISITNPVFPDRVAFI